VELLSIARRLARHRVLVALGAAGAIMIGLFVAGVGPLRRGASPGAGSGAATAKLLVDTRHPFAHDLAGGTEVLGAQAALLATLIAERGRHVAIARAVGIDPDELDVVVSDVTVPQVPSALARGVAKVTTAPRRPYAISVHADSGVSVVTLDAAAPTAAEAASLIRAARRALSDVTVARAPDRARSLVIEPLGSLRAIEVAPAARRSPLVGVAAALVLFVLWCCFVVVCDGLARAWRAERLDPARLPAQALEPHARAVGGAGREEREEQGGAPGADRATGAEAVPLP